MQSYSTAPSEMFRSQWRNRQLIVQMSKRETIGRYRGSFLGIAWSFFNPLLMLAVYTFVFSVVFKARWGIETNENKADFAIILFVGLIVHGLFAECVNRAPSLITSNVNYVKKVVFPLEILPGIIFGSALFHCAISVLVLLIAQLVFKHGLPITTLAFPVILIPLMLGTMGLCWFLAATGVYLRDVSQITVLFTTVMLFISAVFFPINALPEQYQFWLNANPLAVIIEQSREVLIFGRLPTLQSWATLMIAGFMFAWGGFAWFQKTRKGFADVV